MLDDDRTLMHAVSRYLEAVNRVVADERAGERTRLGDEVSAHLGVDATTLPITTETVSAHRYVDADIALDELTERSGGRVIGVTGGEQRLHVSASDLLAGATRTSPRGRCRTNRATSVRARSVGSCRSASGS